MALHVVLGPMFAGKSSFVLREIKRHQIMGHKILAITHPLDTRYADTPQIVNHDRQSHPAVASETLIGWLSNPDFLAANFVVIEEAQFFPDLVQFVTAAIGPAHRKAVLVAGLDGDYAQRPFGHILELIPHAEQVTKLTALCRVCFKEAPFTKRTCEGGQVLVGGAEVYLPVCREHL